eukprot:g14547.t1
MATQRDLSLAYSPGVAAPVEAIAEDPQLAARYTARSNLVAVISNGTAILGLGNLGALASKPVMEGKAVLFKRFADVDSIDIELATEDPDAFVEAVALMEPSFGGINLEDIKAPECFIIEQALRERMNIPVMHDDQHGTAIISAAGLINACHLTGRELKDCKMVVNGAGASALACTSLAKSMGIRHENVIMCDRSGPIYPGRDNVDQWKSAHAVETEARSLEEALEGADIFLGLSAAGALKPEWVEKMADKPIIFAMANPTPEIMPDEAKAVRPDAIIATGRSDFPNQVNNVLGFPFIFRGALDVQATTINEEMKIAAARAIAELARETVPEEVAAAYGETHAFGEDYIIPAPFDPRLMEVVSSAVAKAAMDSGVALAPIEDFDAYRHSLKARLNPTTSVLTQVYETAKANPKRVVFAEAEEDVVLRAAIQFRDFDYGMPVLVGRTEKVRAKLAELAVDDIDSFEIQNSKTSELVPAMNEYLYERLKRRGYTERDVGRMVNQERNVFAALLVALGHGDAMISGLTRTFAQTAREVNLVLDPKPDEIPFGIHLMIGKNYTVFLADTTINERPSAEQLAHIAKETAKVAQRLGHEPRVAFLSYSTFGNPSGKWLDSIRAVGWLATVAPLLIISRGITLVPNLQSNVTTVIANVAQALIVVSFALAIVRGLAYGNELYERLPRSKNRPIKGFIQVISVLVLCGAAIIMVSVLINESPLLLLSGLGAVTAVLLLVFKDTILSLVASVQLTTNDMLRVGDWIEMPSMQADGDVIDISLHTVKVQNFDKTITTIPTYRLVTDSYRNWRGMSEAGGRRIKRALMIDQNSVRFLSDSEVEGLKRFRELRDYLSRKKAEIAEWNASKLAGEDAINARRITNIGTLRAYIIGYLKNHPMISDEGFTLLVRQLSPSEVGLPIELYCFASTTDWGEYESIQADIFDHLLAILPEFDLKIFQEPSGMDLRQLAPSPASR